ncbi:MAG: hypothetical protein CM15mP77_3470 [Synechococcus sp.]|nr:MAG: hypothetical protein CM15mP77_3470 [Synechococcus sp.]
MYLCTTKIPARIQHLCRCSERGLRPDGDHSLRWLLVKLLPAWSPEGTAGLFDVLLEDAVTVGVAQLAQGLGFNLRMRSGSHRRSGRSLRGSSCVRHPGRNPRRSTSRSRGLRVASTPSRSSRSRFLATSCSGFSMSASMKSPRRESSSLPIGSQEIGSWGALGVKRSFSMVISIDSAISSSVGLRPNSLGKPWWFS